MSLQFARLTEFANSAITMTQGWQQTDNDLSHAERRAVSTLASPNDAGLLFFSRKHRPQRMISNSGSPCSLTMQIRTRRHY